MRDQKKQTKRIIFVAIIAILIFLNYRGYLDPIKNLVGGIMTTGFGGARSGTAETKSTLGTLFSLKEIKKENERLKEVEIKLEASEEEKKQLASENDELRNQLKLLPRTKFDLIGADIIAQPVDDPEGSIILNKGEKDGVKEGMAVIIYDKIFIGEVRQVEPSRSKVMLSVNPKETNVFNVTMSDSGAVGIAKGRYNLELEVGLIPVQAEVKEEELVVTGGRNQKYPEGLVVGKVVGVTKSADGLFKQAVVKPFYSVNDLKFAFIIKN